ncbi:MAG TPA: DUF3618 domain-containing protein [Microlunatus sp.]|nr:DUF3618 domain-containing protein [Microlunatus sp.]
MTTSSDPDEIRAEIERTRESVSDDVNRLADAAKPSNIARRQVDKVKDAAINVKDTVMGSASDATNSVGDTLHESAASARDTARRTPRAVRARTRGNPLAAGMIAFGAGLLISSLIPSSQREQEAVSSLQGSLEPLKEEATGAAREVAENLREPAQRAAASVKATVTDAVDEVKQEGSTATEDVRTQVSDSTSAVQEARAH